MWPVVPHGVKLSLGSAEGIDLDRARRLGELARELRAAGDLGARVVHARRRRDIGHLTQLPRTREAVRVVARNVARARRVLPDVPLLLENVAWSLLWPDDEMDEATFYSEIVAATGCDLLLDVGNLYANAVERGAAIRSRCSPAIRSIGSAWCTSPAACWRTGSTSTRTRTRAARCVELVAIVRRGAVPVMIERDADFDFAEIACELAALRALPRSATRAAASRSAARGPDGRSARARSGARRSSRAQLAASRSDARGARDAVGAGALERVAGHPAAQAGRRRAAAAREAVASRAPRARRRRCRAAATRDRRRARPGRRVADRRGGARAIPSSPTPRRSTACCCARGSRGSTREDAAAAHVAVHRFGRARDGRRVRASKGSARSPTVSMHERKVTMLESLTLRSRDRLDELRRRSSLLRRRAWSRSSSTAARCAAAGSKGRATSI